MSEHRPRRAPATLTRHGEHWVLVPSCEGDVAVINETGRAVIEQCDGTRTVDDIARTLTSDGADRDTVLADVTAFLDRMQRAGLLTMEPGTDTE